MGVVKLLLFAYILAIVAVIALSWLPRPPGSPAERAFERLRAITDPVLAPLRRLIPPVGGVLDLSPMIVMFVLLTVYGAL